MHPISEKLCEVYNALYEAGQVSFPLQRTHRHAIDTVVKTVYSEYFGFTMYPTREDRAAAFFCHIIKKHPVVDGNKRLAVLWVDFYCTVFKLPLKSKVPFDELAVAVEQTRDMPIRQLIEIVKKILFSEKVA